MGLRAKKLLLGLLVLTIVSSSFGAMSAMAAEISSLVLNKNELTLEVGSTAALTATAVHTNGTTEEVTVKTDWNSGASDIASVYAGVVTAKKRRKSRHHGDLPGKNRDRKRDREQACPVADQG